MSQLGLEGTAEEMLTVLMYAKGSGLAHQLNKYGPIGHRDILIYKLHDGTRIAYSDFKSNDYEPGEFFKGDVDPQSKDRFYSGNRRPGSGLAVERLIADIPGMGDAYKKGIGTYMQALAIAHLLNEEVDFVQTSILTLFGENLWKRFGEIDSNGRIKIKGNDKLIKYCHSVLTENS